MSYGDVVSASGETGRRAPISAVAGASSSPGIASRWAWRLPAGTRAGLIGAFILLAGWQFLASVVFPGRHVVPAPSSVVATMVGDGFYVPGLRTTLWEAFRGFVAGNLAALLVAVAALFLPRLARPLQQVGAITYCVPTVAVGPLLLVFLAADTTKVIMSALSVFFVCLVAWVTGLSATDPVALDVVRAYGGRGLDELVRVRLRAALPSAGGGLALSAPAAILGAVIGEYLGGNSGLGVDMVSAEEQFQVSRTWAIGVETTVVSGLCYALVLLACRALGGSPQTGTGNLPVARAQRGERHRARLGQAVAPFLSLAGIVALWAISLPVLGLSSYFAKSPAAVWSYLVAGPGAAANRAAVFGALGTTLKDAGAGWLVGTVSAVLAAAAVVQIPRLRSVVYPVVMVLRSVPLIAMVPLITLVFGQGSLGVVGIAAIVSFVPTLVLVVSGLETVPPQALELSRAYNASRTATLFRISVRYATPNLFAAAKVAMPGSILGAVLAEWLITGSGVGHLMAADLIGSDFSSLWAVVVVVSGVSLLLYEAVGALESFAQKQVAS